MARINLLPWREVRRKDQQTRFFTSLLFAAVLTGLGVFFVHYYVNELIAYQQQRNDRLNEEIARVDKAIAEIKELEKTRARLEARMKVIEDLQTKRPGIVHLFDELVGTLPDGTYLTALSQAGENLTINGKAESNARVSVYMRNIDSSDYMKAPVLDVIEAKETAGARISDFRLRAAQSTPKAPAEAEQQ